MDVRRIETAPIETIDGRRFRVSRDGHDLLWVDELARPHDAVARRVPFAEFVRERAQFARALRRDLLRAAARVLRRAVTRRQSSDASTPPWPRTPLPRATR